MHTTARTCKPRRRTRPLTPAAETHCPQTDAPPPNEAAPAPAASPSPRLRRGRCPKDGVGAAVSARNATTHGLFARDVVLPHLGEDPQAFDALLTQLCAQLPPRNLLERHYLEQIAAASWRLRRLHRWQAQIYEDPSLTEAERLDRLDKVLRHEVALTRQIDRAVRTLGRDLKSLFEDRARADALYSMDICESECKADLYRELDIQRRAGAQVRSQSADAPLDYATLDTAPRDDQNRQNENRQNETTPVTSPALRTSITHGDRHPDPLSGANEEGEGRVAARRNGGEDYIAYRKREQELYNRFHPDRSDPTDWNDPDLQGLYAKQ